ncbi:MAG: hypothetical protein IGS39_20860 [Calothrix sp. C42_A2020_038]|nr:hypothetical protein [Calothrix sp. C42_A2020_038]
MAVARKKNVDSSATGGWFRRRRSQRRDSKLSISHNSTNVQSIQHGDLQKEKITGVSRKMAKNQTSQNTGMSNTSMPKKTKQHSRQANRESFVPRSSLGLKADNEIPVMSSVAETMPLWLLRLCQLQRYTSVLSFSLVVATLVAYGLTVYSQQLWSQSYRKLQDLKRNERQLTINNNALKSKIAAEAEKPEVGLVSPSPTSQIFLQKAPDDSKLETPSTLVDTPSTTQNSIPTGY